MDLVQRVCSVFLVEVMVQVLFRRISVRSHVLSLLSVRASSLLLSQQLSCAPPPRADYASIAKLIR